MKRLVIIVTIIGLSAVIGSIITGMIVFDGKVVESPYETGLLYDILEKEKAEILFDILTKDLRRGDNELIFTLKKRNERPITDPQMTLIISRPSTTRFDREIPIEFVSEGTYRAKVNFPIYGYWDIRLKLIHDFKPLVVEKRVYVSG